MTMAGMVAVVTGATKGMGFSIAERFAGEGARVTVSSRSAEDSAKVARELNARFGEGEEIALGVRCDVESRADLEAMVAATLDRWGRIDTAVCSASTLPWFGPSLEMPDDAIDQQFLAVFKSKFWLSNMVIPHMIAQGGGSIIYIASGSVAEATTERSVYSCARAAELQLMKNIGAEFGHANIRVNAISPGMIRSFTTAPLFADAETERKFASRVPMRRGGEPEEIAAAAYFLASSESSYTTGCIITVDGGRLLHAKPAVLSSALAANETDAKRGLG